MRGSPNSPEGAAVNSQGRKPLVSGGRRGNSVEPRRGGGAPIPAKVSDAPPGLGGGGERALEVQGLTPLAIDGRLSGAQERKRLLLPILALIGALCLASPARAQDSGDDALDSLLEKLGEPAVTRADEPKDEGSTVEPSEPAKPAADESDEPKEKGAAKVSSEDQAIDDLLEKLGATKDEPTPDDRPKQPGGSGEKPPEPPSTKGDSGDDQDQDQGRDSGLDDADRRLDERLEELAGRKRKRNQSESKQDEGSGPMGQIIKEMRDIEKRLGEPDTGDETRGKQKRIVQQLETLIEQVRQAKSGSGQVTKMVRQTGRRPGEQQPGDQTGTNPGGAPLDKPARPPADRVAAGGKDEWGHLPDELRGEMENVFKEDSLPIYQDLIRRYYLSVSRGKTSRGE